MNLVRLSPIFVALPLLTACPGHLDDPDPYRLGSGVDRHPAKDVNGGSSPDDGGALESPDDDCIALANELFAQRCAASICHGSESELSLDLESPGLGSRLAGVPGTESCEDQLLVDPLDPQQSLLYSKLTSSPPCGDPMPLGVFPDDLPTEEERACVLAWIRRNVLAGDAGSSVEDAGTPDAAPVSEEPPADAGRPESPTEPLARTGWAASASSTAADQPPSQAIDGNPGTRWSAGKAQAGDEWFQVDLGAPRSFRRIVLDSTGSPGDHPRQYSIRLSSDGGSFGESVGSGAGTGPVTTIDLPRQTARYVRIYQTGTDPVSWWSIHQLDLLD